MNGKKQYRLLMIDDDASLNELLVEYFQRFGHQLTTATTAADGRYLLRRDDPDLLILDVMLPDADGMELCRVIRSESDIPIVMLTARGDVPDRVLGLEFGADDYMPKPFRFDELLARVRLRLTNERTAELTVLSCGGLYLDLRTRRARIGDQTVDLSTREFALTETFLRHPGQVLSREQLLSHVWGYDFDPGSNIVDVYLRYLRRKLGADRFTTVRGMGYRLEEVP